MTDYNLELENIELHLSPEPLARKHVNAIRACAGSYSKCLGHRNRRYVHVPVTERALIDALVRTYSYSFTTKMTVIARVKGHDPRPAWVVVHYVDPHADESPLAQFERKYAAAVAQAERRGIYPYSNASKVAR